MQDDFGTLAVHESNPIHTYSFCDAWGYFLRHKTRSRQE